MITVIKEKFKPNIPLTVQRVEPNIWRDLGFHKHHYLTASLNRSCKCLLFKWGNTPIAFVAIINQPGRYNRWGYRISRIVILPDFQGLGLFKRIINFIGGIVKASNDEAELYIKTIHANAGKSLERNSNWLATNWNLKGRTKQFDEGNKYKNRLLRSSYCFKYIGEKLEGYENLLYPIVELRKTKQSL